MNREKSMWISVEASCKSHLVHINEPFEFIINSNRKQKLKVVISQDGEAVLQDLTVIPPARITTSLPHPGFVRCSVSSNDPEIQPVLCGVGVDPDQLRPLLPEPADFDSFWAKELSALRSVKMEVTRSAVSSPVPGVRAEDVKVNTNTPIPVSGYLLIPENAQKNSLPAVIYFHGAGVRSAIKQSDFAKQAIVFDVNAHGVENGHPTEYYKKLASTELRRCIYRSADDPANSYIKNMFLRTARAVDFVRTLPEWDGKTLIVFGRSQGGAQALAAAALVPEITLCVANVPALADHAGFTVGRQPYAAVYLFLCLVIKVMLALKRR